MTTLAQEEIEKIYYEEISIPIVFNNEQKWKEKIYTIKTKDDFDFLAHPVNLEIYESILDDIEIDLRPKIKVAHELSVEIASSINEPITIPQEYINLIDWNYIYSELMNYKLAKGMYNLILDLQKVKGIINNQQYKIYLNETGGLKIENNGKPTLKITSFEGIKKTPRYYSNGYKRIHTKVLHQKRKGNDNGLFRS